MDKMRTAKIKYRRGDGGYRKIDRYAHPLYRKGDGYYRKNDGYVHILDVKNVATLSEIEDLYGEEIANEYANDGVCFYRSHRDENSPIIISKPKAGGGYRKIVLRRGNGYNNIKIFERDLRYMRMAAKRLIEIRKKHDKKIRWAEI